MKLNIRKYAALMACACGLTITSCTGDLDVTPINRSKHRWLTMMPCSTSFMPPSA